jgi:hypothetical protein
MPYVQAPNRTRENPIVSFTMPRVEVEAIDQLCADEGITRSDLIRNGTRIYAEVLRQQRQTRTRRTAAVS